MAAACPSARQRDSSVTLTDSHCLWQAHMQPVPPWREA
jgi:hypothetical protein